MATALPVRTILGRREASLRVGGSRALRRGGLSRRTACGSIGADACSWPSELIGPAFFFKMRQASPARIRKPRPLRHRCLAVLDQTRHPHQPDGRFLDLVLGAEVGASEPSPIMTPFENDRADLSADTVIPSAINDRLSDRGHPSGRFLGVTGYAGCLGQNLIMYLSRPFVWSIMQNRFNDLGMPKAKEVAVGNPLLGKTDIYCFTSIRARYCALISGTPSFLLSPANTPRVIKPSSLCSTISWFEA